MTTQKPTLTPDMAKVALQLAATAQVPGSAARAVYEVQLALEAIASGEHKVSVAATDGEGADHGQVG